MTKETDLLETVPDAAIRARTALAQASEPGE